MLTDNDDTLNKFVLKGTTTVGVVCKDGVILASDTRVTMGSFVAHKYGKKFAYVMTTGVERLGSRLADAGVDVLYFVDPVQDNISLEKARDVLGQRMTLVGGTNALSLASRDRQRIEKEIKRAIDVLGPTNRFILHPVDAVFPDTPWEGIEQMIEIWQKYR